MLVDSDDAEGGSETAETVNDDGKELVGETVEKNNVEEEQIKEVVEVQGEVVENNVADIQLPSSEDTEVVTVSPPPEETQSSDSTNQIIEEVVEIENIELPPDPEPEPQPVINVQTSETKSSESCDM